MEESGGFLGGHALLNELRRDAEKLRNGSAGDPELIQRVIPLIALVVVEMAQSGLVTNAVCDSRMRSCPGRRFQWKAVLAIVAPLCITFLTVWFTRSR